MILHCVFFDRHPDVPVQTLADVLAGLENLCHALDGALAFETGTLVDIEGRSGGKTEGFIIRFSDRDALDRYAIDPTHRALGAQLCEAIVDGADGLAIYDMVLPGSSFT